MAAVPFNQTMKAIVCGSMNCSTVDYVSAMEDLHNQVFTIHPDRYIHSTDPDLYTADCRHYELVVMVILVVLTSALGVAGNALTLVALCASTQRSVTVFLLTALAVSDIVFLLVVSTLLALPAACRSLGSCHSDIQGALQLLDQYGWAVASMTHVANVYITVLVTVHRYISVCLPHEARIRSTFHKAKCQLTAIILFSIVYNIPRFFEFQDYGESGPSRGNSTTDPAVVPVRTLSKVGDNFWYQLLYKNIAFYLLVFIIPLGTLTVLSYKLFKALEVHRRKRDKLLFTLHQRKEDNTTFALVVIVVIFLLCQTPTMFQRLMYALVRTDGQKCGHFFFYLQGCADYLAIVNSSANFVVYVLFSRHFRTQLWLKISGKVISNTKKTNANTLLLR